VEPGFQNDSAEIRLLHLSTAQALPELDQVNWPASSSDPDVAYDFLTDMSNYLADIADLYQASTVSFLAENIDSRGKASIINTPAGREILHLQASFERSWAAIGRALARAGVEIVAQNLETGVYEVDYVIGTGTEEREEPGFFKKVITLNGLFSREDAPRSFPMRILVLDLDGEVEVIVESLEAQPQPQPETRDAESALLRLVRNFIA
jgi:uncharacterized lipoprotein